MKTKVQLTDGSIYPVESANFIEDYLDIRFTDDHTTEELQTIFQNPGLTSRIKLLNENDEVYADLADWSVHRGIIMIGGLKRVLLGKETSPINKQLSDIQGNLLEVQSFLSNPIVNATIETAKVTAQDFSDLKALQVKGIYPTWGELVRDHVTAKEKGFKFTKDDVLYKTVQPNTEFVMHWIPGEGTENLFTCIDVVHEGTIEDPIPAKRNMEYVKGKYYLEGGNIYQMTRDGMEEGETITLQYLPSQLVDTYFTKKEE